MAAIREAKKLLRKDIKIRLLKLQDSEKKKQSQIITSKLIEHPVYVQSQRISVYLSMPDQEVHTEGILQHIFKHNKLCYVPQYIGPVMNMLLLKSMQDYDSLPKTKWNIKQPAEDDTREDALSTGGLDLIIVPGLGFSQDGDRLGRGKGYYDMYQKKCQEVTGKKPITIALAFNEQICNEIPTTEYDVKIDYVLYGNMV
ncbi:5-formyltetrahydrofolate cyclo-ligase-like [Anneissia japonica]|uniref:5-formyltetrahydrofolate cyclo-ligase-like n=1 Tax=Anneissia japonica TaxID=1529436 RepID=UPI001425A551|nr:5-formyltetrahydrofolate cyclo-ligase-like [Anneissia japonica]